MNSQMTSLAAVADSDFEAVKTAGVFVPLTQFGVIDVKGEDAAAFLHSQITNDVQHLDASTARLAGYCSPKGRLLGSFLMWRSADSVRLLIAQDVQATVQKRLSMFVLRSKAKLSDATSELAAVGFVGDVRASLSGIFDALPDGVHVKVDGPHGVLIRVPDAFKRARFLWIGPKVDVEAQFGKLEEKLRRPPAELWDALDIHAGEPRITHATVEQFVPQMVNFDVLGAVNFKKGCYPGQEIVARSQYRGTIKRRTALAHGEAATPGAELFHSADPGQPCGMVINAAPAEGGGIDCLVEIKLAALDNGAVHVGAADGPALEFLPLPYAFPSDDA
ncbi:Folate-dependent protein for Fe/S cluster synthesis/repair in oxidative stress [Candidatus Burkholderia humilis]|nr:Folate-dependent protein for Fe/S cluster synthesis/repair in oxidative stress [Candidatus Burkholderia humilis]